MTGCGKSNYKSQWVIGFSQVTVKEPWRVVFNEKLINKAAEFGEKIELLVLDADDKTENQVGVKLCPFSHGTRDNGGCCGCKYSLEHKT